MPSTYEAGDYVRFNLSTSYRSEDMRYSLQNTSRYHDSWMQALNGVPFCIQHPNLSDYPCDYTLGLVFHYRQDFNHTIPELHNLSATIPWNCGRFVQFLDEARLNNHMLEGFIQQDFTLTIHDESPQSNARIFDTLVASRTEYSRNEFRNNPWKSKLQRPNWIPNKESQMKAFYLKHNL